MKRRIIKIDEAKCNGCGACIPDCPEGALQVIDGKARLISDLFCDGLGACIKACPLNAMKIEEREAEEYNEKYVMKNIVKAGTGTIKAHLLHLKEHGEEKLFNEAIEYLKENNIEVPYLEEKLACGCPSHFQKDLRKKENSKNENCKETNYSEESKLSNWPMQLKLININATYLENADLVISADCAPFAYSNFHQKFLAGKTLIILCPKLDTGIDNYIEKLSSIFKHKNIKSITIVHMEVPCCSGIEVIVKEALQKANKNIIIKDYTISVEGKLI